MVNKLFTTSLICLLFLIVVTACSNNASTTTKDELESTEEESYEEITPVEEETTSFYDESSPFELTITGVDKFQASGSSRADNGEYTIVLVNVTNKQDETVYVDMESFSLMDQKGNEYTYSLSGQMAWYNDIDAIREPMSTMLYPMMLTEIGIVFDIPSDSGDLSLMTDGDLPFGVGIIE